MSLLTDISHYWKLDESSGNASDSVGSVTLTNAGSGTFLDGIINNGIYSYGTDQPNSYFTSGNITPDPYFSVSFWIKPVGIEGTYGGIISSGSNGFDIYFGTDYKIHFYDGDGGYFTSSETLSLNTWYHIVCVAGGDGGTSRIYVNAGTPTEGPSYYFLLSAATYDIGHSKNFTSDYFIGRIDEIGIWNRVLSQAEITQLYNNGSGFQYPFGLNTNLVSYLKFDESSGNPVDALGNMSMTKVNGGYATAKINNGIDGYNEGIMSETTYNSTVRTQFTVSLWFKIKTELTTYSGTFVAFFPTDWSEVGDNSLFGLAYVASGNLIGIQFYGTDGFGKLYYPFTQTYELNTWYHIAVTWDGTNLIPYLDGKVASYTAEADDPVVISPIVGTETFNINSIEGGSGEEKIIDEFGLWNRALSAQEVAQLYNFGVGIQYPFTNNLATKFLDLLL
jgi:hypothetical protein